MVNIEDLISFHQVLVNNLSNNITLHNYSNDKIINDTAFILHIRLILLNLYDLTYEEGNIGLKMEKITRIYSENQNSNIKWTKFPAQDLFVKNISKNDILNNINSKFMSNIIKNRNLEIKKFFSNKEIIQTIIHFDELLNEYILFFRNKSQGTVYTPSIVTDFMVKKLFDDNLQLFLKNEESNIHFDNEKFKNFNIELILSNLKDIKILDIAVGSGNFVLSIIDYFENLISKYSDKNSINIIIQELLSKIVVIDIDLITLEVFYIRLYLRILIFSLKQSNEDQKYNYDIDLEVIHGNTLLELRNRKFDFIIGNPPYFPIRNLNSITKREYSKLFESYHANGDIYYLFIEKSLKLIKNKNSIVSLIIPRYFSKAPTAKKLNKILETYRIKNVWEFLNKPFKESIYPIIMNIKERERNSPNGEEIITKLLIRKENSLIEENFKQNNVKQLNKDNMVLIRENLLINISRNSENKFLKLNDICQVSKGVQTGKDKIFVVNEEIINKFCLENNFLRPWLKGRMIKAYNITTTEKLFVIHSTQFNATKIKTAKNVMRYLVQFKNDLLSRSRVMDDLWFTWRKGDERSTINWKFPKIITPYKSSRNNFALDTEYHYFSQDIVTIIPKKEYQIFTNYLLALLNSEIVFELIRSEFKELKQDYYEFYPNQLLKIPIILPDKDENLLISEKVNEILKFKKENKSINGVEKEINEILINIYIK